MSELHPDVSPQVARLKLDPGRPLILCDADEVLFSFMSAFERFLHRKGLVYVWRSYALDGNIQRRGGGETVTQSQIRRLLVEFYDAHAEDLSPVPGAAVALQALSQRASILVVTNIWLKHKAARGRALERHGLPYPVISNSGEKGPVVRWLAERVSAPVYFIDDSPRHHESVAAHAGRAVRIHFVAERRLAGLIGPAEHSHFRTDTWESAHAVIGSHLSTEGY